MLPPEMSTVPADTSTRDPADGSCGFAAMPGLIEPCRIPASCVEGGPPETVTVTVWLLPAAKGPDCLPPLATTWPPTDTVNCCPAVAEAKVT
jgi:hypothetical protein